ncbi:MAG: hypothetical protein ACFCD0_08880 [Gemmataceae bacterium]
MEILSHRGYWLEAQEKNTAGAFARSFHKGFGTETDIRDLTEQLMIAHDSPTVDSLPAEIFLDIHRCLAPDVPLALNIKADGLQQRLKELVESFGVKNYFVFDMSIPDTLGYLRQGFPVFTRQSEYEMEPPVYEQAVGVWMDCFLDDWYSEEDIAKHLDAGKKVCLVSPELHRRDHRPLWDRLAGMSVVRQPELMICTDLPEDARRYFDG